MYTPDHAASEAQPVNTDVDKELEKKAYFKSISVHCNQYKEASTSRSLIQFFVTCTLFLVSAVAMIMAFASGAWLIYGLLLLPTAGFLVRLFIMQHDCGHGAFFKTPKANDLLGRFISILTWTPFYYWKRMHNIHHAGSGNLDRRGYGSIETLTTSEYKALSKSDRFKYRLYRTPLILLGLGTPLFIIIGQRFPMTQPFLHPETAKKINFSGSNVLKSVLWTNLVLAIIYGIIGHFVGYVTILAAYLPIVVVTAWGGGWLFYIQHQFEDTYWDQSKKWSYNEAALMGSSYYDLPKVLQWFTGNIGIHHVHHLNASIPNYRLQECLDDLPELKNINRITIKDSFKCAKWALWDEEARKMISFSTLKEKAA